MPGKEWVTDKMPANYEFLGMIHASMPNARIIHMRRNPVDTCFSIYTTPNRVPVEFAYNRENIVFAYKEYERLLGSLALRVTTRAIFGGCLRRPGRIVKRLRAESSSSAASSGRFVPAPRAKRKECHNAKSVASQAANLQ